MDGGDSLVSGRLRLPALAHLVADAQLAVDGGAERLRQVALVDQAEVDTALERFDLVGQRLGQPGVVNCGDEIFDARQCSGGLTRFSAMKSR